MAEYIDATWGWTSRPALRSGNAGARHRLTIVEPRGRLVGMFDLEVRPGELYLETL